MLVGCAAVVYLSHRLSVCLSVTSRYCIEMIDWASWFLAWRLPFTYHRLRCKEIQVPPKIRALLSGTLSQILDLKKFRHGKSIVLSTRLVDDRAC